MKNLLIGLLLGAILMFVAGAAATSGSRFQSTLVHQSDNTSLYALLDTCSGETQLTIISTTGHMVMRTATLDKNGRGDW